MNTLINAVRNNADILVSLAINCAVAAVTIHNYHKVKAARKAALM